MRRQQEGKDRCTHAPFFPPTDNTMRARASRMRWGMSHAEMSLCHHPPPPRFCFCLCVTTIHTTVSKNTLAALGWRNFFSSCAVLSVFGSGWKYVLVYILMYLEYNTFVVLCQFFWFWWKIVFGTYVLHTVSCGVVLVFFVLAGNNFWCYIRT